MKSKGFTLVEAIATLVILSIIALITVPIINNILEKSDTKSRKRSVDMYAHAIELAVAEYELDNGKYPTTLDNLNIKYKGSEVNCNEKRIRTNGKIYLSECYVDGIKVEDNKTFDKYYHYGVSDREYVDLYGHEIEAKVNSYFEEYGEAPTDSKDLDNKYSKDVNCNMKVYDDGKIYLNNCKVNNYLVDDYYYGYPILTDYLIDNSNGLDIVDYKDGNRKELYTFSHPATDQTGELVDYRYIGNVPNNYVMFNEELWRIIGIFEVENTIGEVEKRIKIIREDRLENNMKWDNNGEVNWPVSTLNTYLNNEYYNSLNSDSKDMIDDAKYYLGGSSSSSVSGDMLYNLERSNTVHSGNDINCYNKISLIYASDYGYASSLGFNNSCFSNIERCYKIAGNWLNSNYAHWTLLHHTTNNYFYVFYIYETGFGYGNTTYTKSVRPVTYLVSDIKISGGTGSSDNPYILVK